MLAMQACTPRANQVKPAPTASPILLENVPNLLSPKAPKINNPHFGLGDFGTKGSFAYCEGQDRAIIDSCYNAGGHPLWDQHYTGNTDWLGRPEICITFNRCEYPTPSEINFELDIQPKYGIDQAVIDQTDSNVENDSVDIFVQAPLEHQNIPWTLTLKDQSNLHSYQITGTGEGGFNFKGIDPARLFPRIAWPDGFYDVILSYPSNLTGNPIVKTERLELKKGGLCPPNMVHNGNTPEGEPICRDLADETCEDAAALFPSQLNTPVNAAQNLVQPISDPAPMNQDLGDWQKLLKKLKDRQAKMAAEQAKPNPNQNKINNLQAEANATQAQIDVVVPRIQGRVSQMDSARPALRSALNSVAQAPDFSQDAHADQQAHPLPQTLAEYREAIASLVDEFDLSVSSENTYDLMVASSSLADEQELYGHLVRDILSEKLPLLPEEPDADPTDEPLEQINTPRKLVRWLGKRMVNQQNKLSTQKQALETRINGLLQELNVSASDYTQNYHQQLEQQIQNKIAEAENILTALEAQLLSEEQAFSIQANKNQAQKRQELFAEMAKIQASLAEMSQGVAEGISSAASQAQKKLEQQLKQLQNKAKAYGGDAITQVQAFYQKMDQTFGWLPQWQISMKVRNCIFRACEAPEGNNDNPMSDSELIACGNEMFDKLDRMRKDPLTPQKVGDGIKILRKKIRKNGISNLQNYPGGASSSLGHLSV